MIPKREIKPNIGRRDQMTPYDIEEIKYYYDCGEFDFVQLCIIIIRFYWLYHLSLTINVGAAAASTMSIVVHDTVYSRIGL